jgi:hypothetical protein
MVMEGDIVADDVVKDVVASGASSGLVSIGGADRHIQVSRPELLSVGCKSCIHKLNGMCFYGLTGTQFKDEGYCDKFVGWLLGLAGGSGSATVMWERYYEFVARLQHDLDYADFRRLDDEIKMLEAEGTMTRDNKEMLEQKKLQARIWWSRLNDQVMKYLGRINDRDARGENTDKVAKAISLTQIHKLANAAVIEAKNIEDENDAE